MNNSLLTPNSQLLMGLVFSSVVATYLSFGDIVEFCLDKLFAYGRDMVCIDLTEQMVKLMLDNSRREAEEFLFVRFEILIKPFEHHMLMAFDCLAQSGQGQTAFFPTYRFLVFHDLEFRIYES